MHITVNNSVDDASTAYKMAFIYYRGF